MKNKNPLYVVKGKEVQEASSVFDLVIKKFNLGPAINILKNLFYFLVEQVENWATYQVVKNFIDEFIEKVRYLVKRTGLLEV
jgi:hypothetical protein